MLPDHDVPVPVPLILTLALDAVTQSHFDRLRAVYFPAARNYLSAHLTLFHHLLPEYEAAIMAAIAAACATHAPLTLTVTRPMSLGRGVAYALDAPALVAIHRALAAQWWSWLTPQDRQTLTPHITIQNKVPPAEARALYERLRGEFTSFTAMGEGLSLWRYRGGPWEFVRTDAFTQ